jgi:hypothetical protein
MTTSALDRVREILRLRELAAAARGAGRNGAPAPPPAASEPPKELVARSLKGRKAKPVRYLVAGKIPVGKVSMFAGVGGMGKSTLMRHLIACLTTGRPAFGLDYEPPPACDVLLASVEDSPEDTIVPHLIAEGADLDRVVMVDGVRKGDKGVVLPFDLRDLELVFAQVEKRPTIRVMVIDPIMSFIGRAGVNENSSGEVRTLLDPLLSFSERTAISTLLIAHLNKATNVAAVNRIVGSTAFRDTCRVVFAVGPDPGDSDRRILALVKENVPGLDPQSIAFTREKVSDDVLAEVLKAPEFGELSPADLEKIGQQLAVVKPLGFVDCDADGVLGHGRPAQGGGKVEECMAWLLDFLKDYAHPAAEIERAAKKAGYGFESLKRAKARLGRNGTGQIENRNYGGNGTNDWWTGVGPVQAWTKRPGQTGADRVRPGGGPDEIGETGEMPTL